MALRPLVVLLPLLLLLSGSQTKDYEYVPLELTVRNSVKNTPDEKFGTTIVKQGILLGAMRRLMNSNSGFKFSVTEDPNFGPFLQSVNGLAGSEKERTYWELLVEAPSGAILRPNVGIGCYVPNAHEKIILNYNKW